jgi:hypothetical protein
MALYGARAQQQPRRAHLVATWRIASILAEYALESVRKPLPHAKQAAF